MEEICTSVNLKISRFLFFFFFFIGWKLWYHAKIFFLLHISNIICDFWRLIWVILAMQTTSSSGIIRRLGNYILLVDENSFLSPQMQVRQNTIPAVPGTLLLLWNWSQTLLNISYSSTYFRDVIKWLKGKCGSSFKILIDLRRKKELLWRDFSLQSNKKKRWNRVEWKHWDL